MKNEKKKLTVLIEPWPVGETHHVQNVSDRYVLVRVQLAVVELRVHDYNQVGVYAQRVAHRLRGDYHLRNESTF